MKNIIKPLCVLLGVFLFTPVTIQAQGTASKNWPSTAFAPYVDATLWPTFPIDDVSTTGVKRYVLAFIVSDNSAQTAVPAWGGYSTYNMSFIKDKIDNLRSKGGEVMISFGGAANTPLAVKAKTVEELTGIYKSVIDAYSFKLIDFDIEGAWGAHTESIERRSKSIAALQKDSKYKDVDVWYTLPVLPTGLVADGIKVLKSALTNGVVLKGVNVMAMDYGNWAAPKPEGNMGKYAIQAGTSLFGQLKTLYKEAGIAKTDAELWAMVGITPMIGVNDVKEEVFTIENANELVAFAKEKKIGLLSMWSITRDKQCDKPTTFAQANCSSIDQGSYADSA